MISAATSLADALSTAAAELGAAGVEEPRREARQLMMAALECSLSHLVLHGQEALGPSAARVEHFLKRRVAREPVSRILGSREFFGLDFTLGTETLDPRPDTEVLVSAALAALGGQEAPRLLDLGTGTGAILLALLRTLPEATGIGVDIAAGAAGIAARNAVALGLATRAHFMVGDLFTPLSPEARFNAVLSNPPYIPSADLAGLDPEVRLFDPPRALDGGADGLDFYRRIIEPAPEFLTSGGLLAFEVGQGQAQDVARIMAARGFGAIETFNDLGGIERVVTGRGPA